MPDSWNSEWLSANAARAYPLDLGATATDSSGSFALPRDFLLGLILPVPWSLAVDSSAFFLRAVTALGSGYAVELGYDDGTDDPPLVASATIDRATHREYRAYPLAGVGQFSDCEGKLVVGLLDGLDAGPQGRFVFDVAGGRLDPDCVRPEIRGVGAIVLRQGGVETARLQGDVVLEGGGLTRLTASGGAIVFDVVGGAGMVDACACTGDPSAATPIATINGVPAVNGNFQLSGDACLSVGAAAGSLALADLCSQPCCGCAEDELLRGQLKIVLDAVATLTAFMARLEGHDAQFTNVVLGSKLNDSGCVTCT